MPTTPRFVALIAIVSAVACGPTIPKYDYSKEPDPRKQEYAIGASDMLDINVWNQEKLNREVRVRPDGTITLALLGDIQAAGRTPTELTAEIKRRLAAFVKDENAIVTVSVQQANSYKFTVAGNVEAPGIFGSATYLRIQEAVALAGGVNRYGNSERVTIERTDRKGKIRRIPINMKVVMSGKRPDMNIWILPGDTIVVP